MGWLGELGALRAYRAGERPSRGRGPSYSPEGQKAAAEATPSALLHEGLRAGVRAEHMGPAILRHAGMHRGTSAVGAGRVQATVAGSAPPRAQRWGLDGLRRASLRAAGVRGGTPRSQPDAAVLPALWRDRAQGAGSSAPGSEAAVPGGEGRAGAGREAATSGGARERQHEAGRGPGRPGCRGCKPAKWAATGRGFSGPAHGSIAGPTVARSP